MNKKEDIYYEIDEIENFISQKSNEDEYFDENLKNQRNLEQNKKIENQQEKRTNNFVEDAFKNLQEMEAKKKQLKMNKSYYIYDFVKIRVKIEPHFYILSRFIISRILGLCKVIQFFI